MPLLFAYGTLQDAAVQRALFGRLLAGESDELVGFSLSWVAIADGDAPSGEARYRIVKAGGHSDQRVAGTVYLLSEAELAVTDRYEPAPYERTAAVLASGRRAWVYADGRP